jgi:hypothetical protein
MLIAPTQSPEATASSLLALLELVEDAEVAVAVDVEVTLVQLDAAPAGTVALADKVKSAHCHIVCLSNHLHRKSSFAYLVEITVPAIEEDLNSDVCAILHSSDIGSSEIDREAI